MDHGKYVINLNTFVVHKNPTQELCRCSVTQHGVKSVDDKYMKAFKPEYLRWCFYCFNKIPPEEYRV